MYKIVQLPTQRSQLGTAAQFRFPIENLPLNHDVLCLKLNVRIKIYRTTTSSAVTIANLLSVLSSVTMRAYNRTLIDRLSGNDIAYLGVLAGVGGVTGASAANAGTTLVDQNVQYLVPYADHRQDEQGLAMDTAQDTNLLLINGAIDIVTAALNLGDNGVTNIVEITPIFLVQPRRNLYARPFFVLRKWPFPAIAGIRLDRGVFFDIGIHTTGGTNGLYADPAALINARWAGEAFLDNVLHAGVLDLEYYTDFGTATGQAFTILTNDGYLGHTMLVHRQITELSELSKARRMLESEGRVDITVGTTTAADTAVEVLVREVMPVDDNHFALVCRANGLDPASVGVVPLGNGRDPYQPVMIR